MERWATFPPLKVKLRIEFPRFSRLSFCVTMFVAIFCEELKVSEINVRVLPSSGNAQINSLCVVLR